MPSKKSGVRCLSNISLWGDGLWVFSINRVSSHTYISNVTNKTKHPSNIILGTDMDSVSLTSSRSQKTSRTSSLENIFFAKYKKLFIASLNFLLGNFMLFNLEQPQESLLSPQHVRTRPVDSFFLILTFFPSLGTLLYVYFLVIWVSKYVDKHRNPNINIREIIWLGNQLPLPALFLLAIFVGKCLFKVLSDNVRIFHVSCFKGIIIS